MRCSSRAALLGALVVLAGGFSSGRAGADTWPVEVNLIALPTTLPKICRTRRASTNPGIVGSARSSVSCSPFCSAVTRASVLPAPSARCPSRTSTSPRPEPR